MALSRVHELLRVCLPQLVLFVVARSALLVLLPRLSSRFATHATRLTRFHNRTCKGVAQACLAAALLSGGIPHEAHVCAEPSAPRAHAFTIMSSIALSFSTSFFACFAGIAALLVETHGSPLAAALALAGCCGSGKAAALAAGGAAVQIHRCGLNPGCAICLAASAALAALRAAKTSMRFGADFVDELKHFRRRA